MTNTTRRKAIVLGIKSILTLFAIFIASVIMHEGAHYISALILGVPIAQFNWFNPHFFAPAFAVASREYTIQVAIVSYAGGLFTGILLLSLLVFGRNWFKRSLYRWFIGFFLATFGSMQVCLGVLEGAFHEMYVSDAANLLFGTTQYIGYAATFAGMALYFLLMPQYRKLEI
jgi:hypothetical protein